MPGGSSVHAPLPLLLDVDRGGPLKKAAPLRQPMDAPRLTTPQSTLHHAQLHTRSTEITLWRRLRVRVFRLFRAKKEALKTLEGG